MPMIFRTSLVVLSIILIGGCGGEAENNPAAEASAECTERDGAWFGRRADGTGIISQTQEACEKRLSE